MAAASAPASHAANRSVSASRPTPAPAPPAVRRPPASKAEAKPAAPPASEASAPASAPLAVVGSAPGYYINVGFFAEEANARKAQARLLNEGLPAFRQTLETAKGRRTRVRVGPYDSAKEASVAAARIRAMQLEAVVFKQ